MAKKLNDSQSKQRFQNGVSTVMKIPAGHDDTIRLGVAMQHFTEALLANDSQLIERINDILAMLGRITPSFSDAKYPNKLNASQSTQRFQIGASTVNKIPAGHADTIRLGVAMQHFTDASLANDLQLIEGINYIHAWVSLLDTYFLLKPLAEEGERQRQRQLLIDAISRL
jgi:hypothetical protein